MLNSAIQESDWLFVTKSSTELKINKIKYKKKHNKRSFTNWSHKSDGVSEIYIIKEDKYSEEDSCTLP